VLDVDSGDNGAAGAELFARLGLDTNTAASLEK
jgi:hypothetical protein